MKNLPLSMTNHVRNRTGMFRKAVITGLFISTLLLGGMLPGVIVNAATTTLYVAPNGVNNASSGSSTTPFKTINYALDKALPGTTIIVRAGTYSEKIETEVNGTSKNPITIQTDGKVRLVGTTDGKIISIKHSFYRVKGFELDGSVYSKETLMKIKGSNTVIQSNYFRNAIDECIKIEDGSIGNQISLNQFTNCAVNIKPSVVPTKIVSPIVTKVPTTAPTKTVILSPTKVPTVSPTQVLPAPPTTGLFSLKNWKLTLPIGSSGSPTEIKQPELSNGYRIDPYFVTASTGNGYRFRAPVIGVTTSGSSYPRSELRELTSSGSNASWSSGSGTHTMTLDEAITAVPFVKKHVVAGQIHDAGDDVIVIRLEDKKLFVDINGADGPTLNANYVLGTRFTVKFVVSGNQTKVYYNNNLAYTLNQSYSGAYFKAGAYTQSNCSKETQCSSSNYGEVVIYNATVTHQ